MGIHSNKTISKVEIKSFLGKNDLVWNLNPDVNILSGVNGSGKGALLSIISCLVTDGGLSKHIVDRLESAKITFTDKSSVYYDKSSEIIKTDNEEHLFQYYSTSCARKDLKYYSNVVLDQEFPTSESWKSNEAFLKVMDTFFEDKGKELMIRNYEFIIKHNNTETPFTNWSTEEQNILMIYLTSLIKNHYESIYLINCPEEDLHLDAQKVLIGNLLSISPNKQLVISTCSPDIITNGWHNKVSNMDDLYVKDLVILKDEPTESEFRIIGGW